jgi:hypothetical protein
MLKDALLTCDFVLTPASFHPRFIREKNNDFSLNFTLLTQSQLIKELVIDIHREQAVYKVMKYLNFTIKKLISKILSYSILMKHTMKQFNDFLNTFVYQ